MSYLCTYNEDTAQYNLQYQNVRSLGDWQSGGPSQLNISGPTMIERLRAEKAQTDPPMLQWIWTMTTRHPHHAASKLEAEFADKYIDTHPALTNFSPLPFLRHRKVSWEDDEEDEDPDADDEDTESRQLFCDWQGGSLCHLTSKKVSHQVRNCALLCCFLFTVTLSCRKIGSVPLSESKAHLGLNACPIECRD